MGPKKKARSKEREEPCRCGGGKIPKNPGEKMLCPPLCGAPISGVSPKKRGVFPGKNVFCPRMERNNSAQRFFRGGRFEKPPGFGRGKRPFREEEPRFFEAQWQTPPVLERPPFRGTNSRLENRVLRLKKVWEK